MTGILTKTIFNEKIAAAGSICILGHTSPDGDCVGSILGVYNYIRAKFGDAKTIAPYLEAPNPKFSYLNGFDKISSEKNDTVYDLAVVVDCADQERMGKYAGYFLSAKSSVVVDHHFTNAGFGEHALVRPDASSTCEVLYELFDEELFNKPIAECLYTGIVHDTGVFRHSSTHGSTMRIAGKCMEQGINFNSIIEDSFFSMTYGQKKLLGYLLNRLETVFDGKLVYSYISYKERLDLGAEKMDMDGIIDNIRTTAGALAAVYMYGTNDGKVKVSLRSNSDLIDVSLIAAKYGGGGHKRAAGCFMSSDMEKNINNISMDFKEQLENDGGCQ